MSLQHSIAAFNFCMRDTGQDAGFNFCTEGAGLDALDSIVAQKIHWEKKQTSESDHAAVWSFNCTHPFNVAAAT